MRTRLCCLFFVVLAASPSAAPKHERRTDPPPAKVNPDDVIAYLEESIAWYRTVVAAEQLSGVPSDLVVREATLQRAVLALQLAFDFARAEAAFLAAEKRAEAPDSLEDSVAGHSLTAAAANAARSVSALQDKLKTLSADLAKAPGKSRALLEARQRELQAELALAKQAQASIQSMLSISGENGSGQKASGGLLGQIETLERSVPEARHSSKDAPAPKSNPPSQWAMDRFHPENAGFVSLITEVTTLTQARGRLDDLLASTDTLLNNIDRLKNPLVTALRNSIQRGQSLADKANTDNLDNLEAGRAEIEQLTAQFQVISTATIPIGEQQLLIEAVRNNVSGWRNSISREAAETWRYLLLRGSFMILAILAVFGLSELWRRTTLRYVTDQSKRRQFVVLRRTGMTISVIVILAAGFATDLSSLATYAGFLTAGVALGLQNVVLSVVAYFFLIGKYGIKAGDRVSINGVTGDVIDVGLVRLYMVELGGDLRPTGRTVVYANSIAFQPSALFKQVPGADYTWRTAFVTLSAETELETAKQALSAAVHQAYADFRAGITEQHNRFEQSLGIDLTTPEPGFSAAFTETGLACQIQYPADLKRTAEMDERMLKALREACAGFQIVSAPRLG